MIGVIGAKGGSGRTTTTLGVAQAIGTRQQPALAVDCDWGMPELHLLANVDRYPIAKLSDQDQIPTQSQVRRPDQWSTVRVLPAIEPTREQGIQQMLDQMRWEGQIIVDGPSGVGQTVSSIIKASDQVIVTGTGTTVGIQQTAKTIRMANTLDTPVISAVIREGTPPYNAFNGIIPECRVHTVPEISDDPLSATATKDAYQEISNAIGSVAQKEMV
ncbi:P-loop NTPase [Salinarchaeum sp. IM2453]|uniref:MinD/ParA family ATP-binding protein n=1 Tax=Salinarchaeum sp. IM2453 TaxID=2862870 RepID=UPI001C835876|nr:P-loop NTPase [Salinarchaeum sp. IM2453]QZA88865.1 P-loop NTPase [Salinarchaeum sp. IM2453]